jgi:hypothetical protein
MDNCQVIQCFRGKPVRFFRATFETDVNSRSGYVSQQKFQLQTYALPLIDFCNACGCDKAHMMKHFEALKETFQGLFITESLSDTTGKLQPGIIMAHEMVIGLASSLCASPIESLTRARLIDFQRWMLRVVSLIRKGNLNFTNHPFNIFKNAPPKWVELLSLRSGHMLAAQVKAIAREEGISAEHAYRRLNQMRGGNVLTAKGIPRKKRGGN